MFLDTQLRTSYLLWRKERKQQTLEKKTLTKQV